MAGRFQALDSFQQLELGLQEFLLTFPRGLTLGLVCQVLGQGPLGGAEVRLPLVQFPQGLTGLRQVLGRCRGLGEQVALRGQVRLSLAPVRQFQAVQKCSQLLLLSGQFSLEAVALGTGGERLGRSRSLDTGGRVQIRLGALDVAVLGQPPVLECPQTLQALEETRELVQQGGVHRGSLQQGQQLAQGPPPIRQGGLIPLLLSAQGGQ